MNRIFTLLLSLFLVSCANTQNLQESDAIPSLQLEAADRACSTDADCTQVMTQCSCACGQGVNMAHADKYVAKIDQLCTDYEGMMCKVQCDGAVKCVDSICTYIAP